MPIFLQRYLLESLVDMKFAGRFSFCIADFLDSTHDCIKVGLSSLVNLMLSL